VTVDISRASLVSESASNGPAATTIPSPRLEIVEEENSFQ
jgi:hypothetical protein